MRYDSKDKNQSLFFSEQVFKIEVSLLANVLKKRNYFSPVVRPKHMKKFFDDVLIRSPCVNKISS